MTEIQDRIDFYDSLIVRFKRKEFQPSINNSFVQKSKQIARLEEKIRLHYPECLSLCSEFREWAGFGDSVEELESKQIEDEMSTQKSVIMELEQLCASLMNMHVLAENNMEQEQNRDFQSTDILGEEVGEERVSSKSLTVKRTPKTEYSLEEPNDISDSGLSDKNVSREQASVLIPTVLEQSVSLKDNELTGSCSSMSQNPSEDYNESDKASEAAIQNEDQQFGLDPTPIRVLLHASKQQIHELESEKEDLEERNRVLRERNSQLLLNNRQLQKSIEYYRQHCKYADLNEEMQRENRELVEAIQRLKGEVYTLRGSVME